MHNLYIVSTPIGNLEDITLRALRILKESSLILAEDTRHSRKLFDFYEIKTPVLAYHEHNKEKVGPKFIAHLKEVGDIALVSDAGTPGIADPGFNLVRDCVEEGINVVPIPGASALLSALVASGLPTDRFHFEYFAPKKSGQRRTLFEKLKQHESTILLYVTPHQLTKLLVDFLEVYGDDHPMVLARELTKKFEEFERGTAPELIERYKNKSPKGEYVLVFHPQKKGLK